MKSNKNRNERTNRIPIKLNNERRKYKRTKLNKNERNKNKKNEIQEYRSPEGGGWVV